MINKKVLTLQPDMTVHTCIHERNIALQDMYKRILRSHVNKNLLTDDMIVSIILEQPAPRFYLTPHRARKLLIRYYNADCKITPTKSSLKQQMIADLAANYERLRKQFPHTPKDKIYEMVVEQPAKSFYMNHFRVKEVIRNYCPCRVSRPR